MSDNDKTVFVNFEKEMPGVNTGEELPDEEKLSAEAAAVLAENVEQVLAEKETDAFEKELEALYLKLGKAYYEGGFEDPLPELLPLFDKITGIKTEMEERRRQETEQEDKETVCPVCGAKLEKDAKFCGNCGNPVG